MEGRPVLIRADSEGTGAKTIHHRGRCACGGDVCVPISLQNVQISGSMADGHKVLARADEILRVIRKNHAEKYLEIFTEIAEKNDDHKKFYEQFGECLNFGNHHDSTIGTKISEVLRLNASTSEDEQLSLKEYVEEDYGGSAGAVHCQDC